jgi:hypothetical protein
MGFIDKIKLLFVAAKPAQAVVTQVSEIKKGYKTISFWVATLGSLITFAGAIQGFIPATVSLIVITALTCVYNILRALEQANQPGVGTLGQSTRFYSGLLGIVLAGLTSLKTGGVDPKWVEASIAFIGTIMTVAQSLGAQQPTVAIDAKK